MEDAIRYEGTVIFFNKNFGFLEYWTNSVKQKDMFVYWSDICCEGYKKLVKGQSVSFAIGKNHHGQDKAIEVIIR